MNFLRNLCRSRFYKVLGLAIVSVLVLQYGLSVAFYGRKPYFSIGASYLLLYSENVTILNGTTLHACNNDSRVTMGPGGVEEPWSTNISHSVSGVPNTTMTLSAVDSGDVVVGSNVSRAVNLTKCPTVPPKLVGPVKVLTTAPPLEELWKLHPTLEMGGRFRPPECISRYKVAIIIPYRDREAHLRLFLHNLHPILQRQQLDYGIFVIEEAGQTKFNRAMLMNIGFAEALKLYDWQCFIFHDVDLLPEDDRNIYSCPEQPRHMSVAVDTLGYKLPYVDIFGGVSALTKEQMEKVNGFSNQFWGWGGEDDDMANRIKYYGYKISRYPAKIARYKMMKHTKDKPNPDRYNQLYKGKLRYKTDGINNLKYTVKKVELKKLFTWVYVELHQDK